MNTLINQNRFIKAVEYADRNYFSEPYSLSPMVGRWFNQLAIIELENGKLVQLSGNIAKKYVDITLDGSIVNKKEIELVSRFYDKDSDPNKILATITAHITRLNQELKDAPDSQDTKQIEAELKAQQKRLRRFDADKLRATELYNDIVARGKKSINEKAVEGHYKSKIKHIIHRPNHGLTHSVRAAFYITAIHSFKKEVGQFNKQLNNQELEKLQMMMLFSVVGRRDETGFNDGPKGRATYKQFRIASGRAYVNYFKEHDKSLYGDDLESLYQDAIIVELMGYSSIKDFLDRNATLPELYIDGVIAAMHQIHKVTLTRDQALTLITEKGYNMQFFLSQYNIIGLLDAKLDMMNKSHALDLIRCYPLYALKEGGAKSISVLNTYLGLSGIYDAKVNDGVQKLSSAFKLLRYGFDTLATTGQKSMFGFISEETFEANKEKIFATIEDINQQFTPPISEEDKAKFIAESRLVQKEIESYWILSNPDEEKLIDFYRKYLILKETVKHFTAGEKLNYDNKMFDFQHDVKGATHQVDHHKNASSLVRALDGITPVPGVSPIQLPVIQAVKHDRANNLVSLVFDDPIQADLFKNTYTDFFNITPIITTDETGSVQIVVDRKNYQQLVDDRLVEFKLVTVPAEINREASLITEDGAIEALNLIAHSRALVRVVSTSSLNGEPFPDYNYMLKALEDPVHERYIPSPRELDNFPIDRSKYYDPRTGECHIRQVMTRPTPELRYQEPVTESKRFSDKVADGLISRATNEAKNTLFTKKLAHTLLPSHGQLLPFEGYSHKKSNYFPIGILSDLDQVDLKDERYVWTQNMVTYTKFWIRNGSKFNTNIYKMLHAQLDQNNQPIRDTDDKTVRDPEALNPQLSSPDVLIKYLEQRAKQFLKKIDEKHYRPTNEAIIDFKNLLKLELNEYLQQVEGNDSAKERVNEIYAALEERLTQEAARKHPKYAITIRELIEHQKNNPQDKAHNEILAGNTKGAIRSLYASKDELFERLNLVFHAMHIKKNYKYDVPLLVISADKPPYHYTETMIKADLKEAYKHLRAGTFPYDTTQFPAYETHPDGTPVTKNRKLVRKKNEQGKPFSEIKNQEYQKNLLVQLFQMGIPELHDINNLSDGQIGDYSLDGTLIEEAIESIIVQMDLIGGVAREEKRMISVLSQNDNTKKDEFFLRQAVLGHFNLIGQMLYNKEFTLSEELLTKAKQFARKNNHALLSELLGAHLANIQSRELKPNTSIKSLLMQHPNQETLLSVLNEIDAFKEQYKNTLENIPELSELLQQTIENIFLSPASYTTHNKQYLSGFMDLLKEHPEYVTHYAKIIAADKPIKLDQLLAAKDRLGAEATGQAISLIATRGWEEANNYLLMREFEEDHHAHDYLNNQPNVTESIQAECQKLLQEIEQQKMGNHDAQTADFCEAMNHAMDLAKGNPAHLAMNLQKIKAIHQAVTSPEMIALQQQIKRLEKNASSFFGIGNQKKANEIIEAARQIPLNQRTHIFSAQDPAFDKVKTALAAHRISSNLEKKTRSYKEMMQAVKTSEHEEDPNNERPHGSGRK